MATADPAVLDDFLNQFRTQVDAGFGLIQADVSTTLGTLVAISIALTALLWAIDENQNVLAALVRKVLLVGFFAWLVTQWHSLSMTVVNGFAALGLKAGGGSMTVSSFTTSPSQIVMAGINVISGLMQFIKKIAPGPIEFFAHIDVVAMALVAAVGVLIAFVVLAVEITTTVIEFHIVTLVAFVTVPFGVMAQTAFMSERAIGYVVSVGIKLMALALVVSLGTTVFDSYTVSSDPGIGEDVGLLLAAVLMVTLALKAPAIAGALISGGPQLSAGGAVVGAAGVAAGVAGGALALRTLGGAVAGGWTAGAREVSAAKAASGALAPHTAEAGGARGEFAGAGGFANAPVASSAQTLHAAIRRLGGAGPQPSAPPEPYGEDPEGPGGPDDLKAAAGEAARMARPAEESGPGLQARIHPTDDPGPG